jgi:hypothetical protein
VNTLTSGVPVLDRDDLNAVRKNGEATSDGIKGLREDEVPKVRMLRTVSPMAVIVGFMRALSSTLGPLQTNHLYALRLLPCTPHNT